MQEGKEYIGYKSRATLYWYWFKAHLDLVTIQGTLWIGLWWKATLYWSQIKVCKKLRCPNQGRPLINTVDLIGRPIEGGCEYREPQYKVYLVSA